ncbi:unnamed protein product [Effrenium voratum]|uniref:Uncharacterized protein n=1 Tax=Effrenium voratum TaxID=2562239 RepID=A0AA36HZW6_9DINO|nr:unnamed protein product [Effrenium voratum]
MSASMASSPGRESDLLNCHFSVNQQALISAIKPIMSELAQEWGYEPRLAALEKSLGLLQKELALKAEAAGLQGMRKELEEQRQQIQQKASQAALATAQAQLRSLEATLAWKADQSVLEEHLRSIEVATKLADSKADQSGLNRALAVMQKVQNQAAQLEKSAQDLQGRMQKLEMHNLPGHVQRMSEQVGKSRNQLLKFQEQLSSKVDARDVEALSNLTKELQTTVALKVGPQSLQEVRSGLRDLQLRLDLKVDTPVLEELRSGLNKVQSQLTQKADAQELREATSNMQSLRANMDGKVDFALLSELRLKLQSIESTMDKKTDCKDIPDLSWLKDCLAQKAEKRQAAELSSALERLQQELHFSLENERVTFKRDLEARVAKMGQFERDLQHVMTCVEGMTVKVDSMPASPRLDIASPRGSSPCPSPSREVNRTDHLEDGLRQVAQALESKVDREELEDQLALAASFAEQQQAMSRKLTELEGQVQSASSALLQKADRSEIEELLSAAAEAAAEGISGSIQDTSLPGAGLEGAPLPSVGPPAKLECSDTAIPELDQNQGGLSLYDAPAQSERVMAQSTPSEGSLTTPRMKGSASAPSSQLTSSIASSLNRARSGNLGRGYQSATLTGLPPYPAKGPRVSKTGWR